MAHQVVAHPVENLVGAEGHISLRRVSGHIPTLWWNRWSFKNGGFLDMRSSSESRLDSLNYLLRHRIDVRRRMRDVGRFAKKQRESDGSTATLRVVADGAQLLEEGRRCDQQRFRRMMERRDRVRK